MNQITKTIAFVIPHAAKPQAYSTTLTLTADGKQASNSVPIHYVIQGVSGTLFNLVIDKTKYRKGDTAMVTFSWSGSADNFPGARVVYNSEGVELCLPAIL